MIGTNQILIPYNDDLTPILEYVCSEANKLNNCAIYYCRQMYLKANTIVHKYKLDKELKTNIHYKALRSNAGQQVLHTVAEAFESFKKLNKMFWDGELKDKPKLPKYRRKGGLAGITYPKQIVKLLDGNLKFTLGKQVKAWFGFDHFYIPMPSHLNYRDIKEYRFLPRNGCFYLELVYEQKPVKQVEANRNVLGIDHGLNNWLTCVSNVGKSFIVDGRKVKSQNQYYNKLIAKLKKDKPQGYWDNKLAHIAEKRNRQMRDNINKAARFVINWCLKHDISTILFGWNEGNKDGINIGKVRPTRF